MALSNSERQSRWRAKRAAELKKLRRAAAKALPEPDDQPAPEATDKWPKRRRGKPLSNAERQAKWRATRAAEVKALRKIAAKAAPAARVVVPKRQRRPRYVTAKRPKHTRFSEYNLPAIDPLRDALAAFDELAVNTHKQLIADLMAAISYALGGVKAGKRHVSDKALGRHIFLADIRRALERAGLPVKQWEKHEYGGGESLYYQIAHAVADAFGLRLPQYLKPLALRAAQIQYDVMSPAMAAWQAAELAAAP